MKKILFVLSMAALVSSCAVLKKEKTPTACGDFTVDTLIFDKIVHDFDTIPKNGDGTCTFVFTNCSKNPTVLTNVRASCGCTTPEWPKDTLAPYSTSEIIVKYDTKRIGAFNKTIRVYSNLSNGEPVTLTIKGTVLATE